MAARYRLEYPFSGSGANGRALCRWCGTEVSPPRRTWCSEACVLAWEIRTRPGVARKAVRKRDKGVCALCRLDTGALRRRLNRMKKLDRAAFTARRLELQALGFPKGLGHLWEADHIVPVVAGGGACGLENYRTLCVPCHKGVTADLARARAGARIAKD